MPACPTPAQRCKRYLCMYVSIEVMVSLGKFCNLCSYMQTSTVDCSTCCIATVWVTSCKPARVL